MEKPSEGQNSGSWESRVVLMKAKCRKAETGKQKQYEPTYPVFGLHMEWDDKKEKGGWQHKNKIMNGCWLKWYAGEKQLLWWLWCFFHIRHQGRHKEMWGWSRMWGGWLEAAWVRQWWCEMQITETVLALLTPDAYMINIYTYTLQSFQKKTLTSSEVSCSSLQDHPGSPFLNHPSENSLIRECQLKTWQ